ncbi:site-specific integrase [Desulfopila sp. IMCC35006]|uniref:tyrosine-type recombinase/integrase n=1 Tax=Desulfopila sp. IMCC35006 TaxID=2569542 RepID=UPI0010AD23D1|nr:site-specific integrase [Desulfopila sp. IMCC35006]TKB25276.1 site-specific integrase [Desulfopila sp. IMCC35006]
MSEWKKSQYKGLRYREHETNTTGVGRSKRPLRYYVSVYKLNNKTVTDVYGWEGTRIVNGFLGEGDHPLTEDNAHLVCAKLEANRRSKTPPFTLAEYRQQNQDGVEARDKAKQEEEARNITFAEIFTEHYFPYVQHNRRNQRSIEREEDLFRLWINPVIGDRPIREVMPIHLEKIKKNMAKVGRAPRTIQYCLAVVRQIFNYSLNNNLFVGKNPAGATGGVKRPKVDNRRTRFLSRQEAADLLAELSKNTPTIHDIALFALYTGSRASEVFNLQWGDVDLFQGVAILKDTKSGKNRAVYLTQEVKVMLTQRRSKDAQAASLVFPGRDGVKIMRISNSFAKAVDKLKLNDGVADPRQRVMFHTLRHTFASWLAMDGINPFHLKELLGHSDLKLTERYSHLSESALKTAALRIQNG